MDTHTADIAPAPLEGVLLDARNVSKSFGSFRALDRVRFDMRAGEIHALMGENGAGKSTLIRIITGATTPDVGAEICFNGQKLLGCSPFEVRRRGIAAIYQELSLAPNLSVAENIFLGVERRRYGLIDRAAMNRDCGGVLKSLGAQFEPTDRVKSLSLSERQLVEIARAVRAGARLIVMDEPTTSLSNRESERFFEVLNQLRSDGIAILYVSHRMEEVYALSDRATVLRDGAYVGTLDGDEVSPDRLVKMMVGRALSSLHTRRRSLPDTHAPIMFEVRNVSDGDKVRGCSFRLRKGEVLGLGGLVGAGRTELALAIIGAIRRRTGEIYLHGKQVSIATPAEALKQGISYLTEDRRGEGLFTSMTVRDNINSIAASSDSGPLGTRNFAAAARRSREMIDALSIRLARETLNASALSGGNQQKVLLARLLTTKPSVIFLDEPTRGIDLGAKAEIYALIDRLAESGVGVIVISSELAELVGVADRVLVIREGEIAGEVAWQPDADTFQEKIIGLATNAQDPKLALQAGVERGARPVIN